jgi:hypothetical protein
MACTFIILGACLGGLFLYSASRGQETAPPSQPEGANQSTPGLKIDPAQLTLLEQQMLQSAQQGCDWLRRANRPDGRFVNGFVPDLKAALEGDHYLRHVGAALALAKFATLSGDSAAAALARQSLLTLLLDTAVDESAPDVRRVTLPALVVNPLGAAGLLVMAIHALPDPGEDLLDQAEQLCRYIRGQQKDDGSFSLEDAAQGGTDPEAINAYPGQALAGILASQARRPEAWKIDAARKAFVFYREWWRGHKNPSFPQAQATAWASAYVLTKETPFAEFVYEMNEWLCGLQYTQLDPRHPLWQGGFMEWSNGHSVPAAPRIDSAMNAESLAQACRLARQMGDLQHYQQFHEALERCLQFLTTLQYNEANTQHFADWYRPALVGGFHASHQDGNLRIDYTQHAVAAMVDYLAYGRGN